MSRDNLNRNRRITEGDAGECVYTYNLQERLPFYRILVLMEFHRVDAFVFDCLLPDTLSQTVKLFMCVGCDSQLQHFNAPTHADISWLGNQGHCEFDVGGELQIEVKTLQDQ